MSKAAFTSPSRAPAWAGWPRPRRCARAASTSRSTSRPRQFTRLGAGIQIGCNAMHVLRGLGLEARLRAETFYPRSWNNRDWQTGEVLFDMRVRPRGRGEIRRALSAGPSRRPARGAGERRAARIASGSTTGWPASSRRRRRRAARASPTATTAEADAVIGADGVNSVVRGDAVRRRRAALHRAHRLSHGLSGARCSDGFDIGDCTKWWGEDRHIVMYPVKPDRSRSLLRHQPARARLRPRIVVGNGRRQGAARGVRGLPSRRAARARRLPRGPQAAAGRSRAARALGRGQRGAAGRRLPSDDALHGAGRGDGDRGCGDPVALPRRTRIATASPHALATLRGDAQGTDGAGAAHLAPEQSGARA